MEENSSEKNQDAVEMRINTSSQDIKVRVLECIEKKQSFFMLRLGDGDMITVQNNERLSKYSHNLIGRNISSEELSFTQTKLKKCVLMSDILGLPTEKHVEKHELWKYLYEYYENIRKSSNGDWIEKKYCSIDSHTELLSSGDLFEILGKVSKIVIVSPRNVVDKLKQKFKNLLEIEYYSIPGEQKYEDDKYTGIDFFDRIKEIISAIKSKAREGELLIYGAGTFGKVLGLEFKIMGGVVLDIGSVFDLFVGKMTRGFGKGPGKYTTAWL